MPFIKPPSLMGDRQTATLHVTSRSEQRKTMQPKEPSGSLKILLFQFVLFFGLMGTGISLFLYASVKGSSGIVFLGSFSILFAFATLFWLVPNFKAWRKSKK